jgi:hypothetical protein
MSRSRGCVDRQIAHWHMIAGWGGAGEVIAADAALPNDISDDRSAGQVPTDTDCEDA